MIEIRLKQQTKTNKNEKKKLMKINQFFNECVLVFNF